MPSSLLDGRRKGAGPDAEMVRGFDLIAQLAPLIAKHQGDGTMSAVLLAAADPPKKIQVGITPWRSRVCAPGLLRLRRQASLPRYSSPPA